MADTPTIAVTRRFLLLILAGTPPSDAVLAQRLDELALAYHDTPDGEPADDEDRSPPQDYQRRCELLTSRFPDYHHYSTISPFDDIDKAVTSGAIDDLADITGDLEEVIWRFEHIGADDAHWHFKMLYEIHWGRHLRELSYYLYERERRRRLEDCD